MNLETASAIAARLGFVLPTRKMVDAIYRQSAYHFVPEPLPPGPHMRVHRFTIGLRNEMIQHQAQDPWHPARADWRSGRQEGRGGH